MKKIKYVLFSIFLILSFYVTDQIMIYIDNQNPLMKRIVNISDEKNILAVDAKVENNTIIPGIKGKEVNKHKSLLKMEEFGSFNESYLVYDLVKPSKSLEDNKDKIIIKANPLKRSVSLIIEENNIIEEYLISQNIKYDILASLNSNFNIEREYLNSEKEEDKFSDLDSILNKKKINKKICILNYSNLKSCKKNKYYIVSASIDVNNTISSIINKINSGDILIVSSKVKVDELKLIINEIKRLDLNIVYLSKLIEE